MKRMHAKLAKQMGSIFYDRAAGFCAADNFNQRQQIDRVKGVGYRQPVWRFHFIL